MKALAQTGLPESILFLCTLPQLPRKMEVNLKYLRSPLLGRRFQRLSPAVVLSLRWFVSVDLPNLARKLDISFLYFCRTYRASLTASLI